jgi:hypothetical protein
MVNGESLSSLFPPFREELGIVLYWVLVLLLVLGITIGIGYYYCITTTITTVGVLLLF